MLAGLALFLIAYFFQDSLGGLTRWISIAGLLLTGTAFALSIVNRGAGARTPLIRTGSGRVRKSWRGQEIEYGEASFIDRLRDSFRRKGPR